MAGSSEGTEMAFEIVVVGPDDTALVHGALNCFAAAFEDSDTYSANRPDRAYLRGVLAGDSFVCLVALVDGVVVGALAAYVLPKIEQARSELYIYDLAVIESAQRQGVATGLINALKPVARARGAWVIYVQADDGDEPAVALYSKLGTREDVLHFDIPVT